MRKICEECGKSFAWKHHLDRHTNTVHYREHHQCSLCLKVFARKDNLIKHGKRHCKKVIKVGTVISIATTQSTQSITMGPQLPSGLGQANNQMQNATNIQPITPTADMQTGMELIESICNDTHPSPPTPTMDEVTEVLPDLTNISPKTSEVTISVPTTSAPKKRKAHHPLFVARANKTLVK